MKRTRHSAEQIVAKLREADAMLAARQTVAQVMQQLGVSEQTYSRWRSQYEGMKANEARRDRCPGGGSDERKTRNTGRGGGAGLNGGERDGSGCEADGRRGVPVHIRSDNEGEFIAGAI